MSREGQPRVSVVVPAYNPGPRLRAALADVCAQSMPDWECVVVDDGSREDLSWVGDVDPRVSLHRQDNAGVSRARNAAVALARAPYIAFLDQDDRWHADRLGCALDLIADFPEAAMWTSQFRWEMPQRHQTSALPPQGSLRWFLAEGGACQSAVTVRRSDYLQIGGQRSDLLMCQDFEMALRLMAYRQAPMAVHPRELVTYVVHGDNASGNFWRTDQEFREVYGAQLQTARTAGQTDLVDACRTGLRMRRRTHAYQAIDAARVAWSRHDGRGSVGALIRGLRCDPRVLAQESVAHARRRLTARLGRQ